MAKSTMNPQSIRTVSLAAGLIMALTGGAKLFALRGTKPRRLGGVFPFSFPAPFLEGEFALLASFGRCVKKKRGDPPAGQRLGSSFSRQIGDLINIFNKFGGRQLDDAAIVIPGGAGRHGICEGRKLIWIECGNTRARGPVSLEELGGILDEVQCSVRSLH